MHGRRELVRLRQGGEALLHPLQQLRHDLLRAEARQVFEGGPVLGNAVLVVHGEQGGGLEDRDEGGDVGLGQLVLVADGQVPFRLGVAFSVEVKEIERLML